MQNPRHTLIVETKPANGVDNQTKRQPLVYPHFLQAIMLTASTPVTKTKGYSSDRSYINGAEIVTVTARKGEHKIESVASLCFIGGLSK